MDKDNTSFTEFIYDDTLYIDLDLLFPKYTILQGLSKYLINTQKDPYKVIEIKDEDIIKNEYDFDSLIKQELIHELIKKYFYDESIFERLFQFLYLNKNSIKEVKFVVLEKNFLILGLYNLLFSKKDKFFNKVNSLSNMDIGIFMDKIDGFILYKDEIFKSLGITFKINAFTRNETDFFYYILNHNYANRKRDSNKQVFISKQNFERNSWINNEINKINSFSTNVISQFLYEKILITSNIGFSLYEESESLNYISSNLLTKSLIDLTNYKINPRYNIWIYE